MPNYHRVCIFSLQNYRYFHNESNFNALRTKDDFILIRNLHILQYFIGGNNNTLSFIWIISQGILSETANGSVLDCREYRPFTAYWGDGQILVKKGDTTAAKSNIFLNLSLPFNLHYVN